MDNYFRDIIINVKNSILDILKTINIEYVITIYIINKFASF
jgi:hypothetical protein